MTGVEFYTDGTTAYMALPRHFHIISDPASAATIPASGATYAVKMVGFNVSLTSQSENLTFGMGDIVFIGGTEDLVYILRGNNRIFPFTVYVPCSITFDSTDDSITLTLTNVGGVSTTDARIFSTTSTGYGYYL